jgi:hypothetical protein
MQYEGIRYKGGDRWEVKEKMDVFCEIK